MAKASVPHPSIRGEERMAESCVGPAPLMKWLRSLSVQLEPKSKISAVDALTMRARSPLSHWGEILLAQCAQSKYPRP